MGTEQVYRGRRNPGAPGIEWCRERVAQEPFGTMQGEGSDEATDKEGERSSERREILGPQRPHLKPTQPRATGLSPLTHKEWEHTPPAVQPHLLRLDHRLYPFKK